MVTNMGRSFPEDVVEPEQIEKQLLVKMEMLALFLGEGCFQEKKKPPTIPSVKQTWLEIHLQLKNCPLPFSFTGKIALYFSP